MWSPNWASCFSCLSSAMTCIPVTCTVPVGLSERSRPLRSSCRLHSDSTRPSHRPTAYPTTVRTTHPAVQTTRRTTTVTEHGMAMPNSALTPGAAVAGVTTAQVCAPGWSSAHRDVTQSERYAVFAAYGIPYAQHASYELDHLIPLGLGGSNAETNLWPEPQTENDSTGPDKDALENHLHALVCSGQLSLATAQHAIAADWVTAWDTYESIPVATTPQPSTTAPCCARWRRRGQRWLGRRRADSTVP